MFISIDLHCFVFYPFSFIFISAEIVCSWFIVPAWSCADLEPETRKALESHYAMDYCLFGFATLPKGGEDSCVGTGKDKNWFTVKYQEYRRIVNEDELAWNSGT